MKRITSWFLVTLAVVVLLFAYDGSTSATTAPSRPSITGDGAGSSANGTGPSLPGRSRR